jgi:hypothetical protein
MKLRKYLNFKKIIAVFIGALAGFGYYYFVGCRTGSCPISGSPYISTIYGAVMGLLFVFPSGKRKDKVNETNN